MMMSRNWGERFTNSLV